MPLDLKADRSDGFHCSRREEFGGGEMVRGLEERASSLRLWSSLTPARLAAGPSLSVGLGD